MRSNRIKTINGIKVEQYWWSGINTQKQTNECLV